MGLHKLYRTEFRKLYSRRILLHFQSRKTDVGVLRHVEREVRGVHKM